MAAQNMGQGITSGDESIAMTQASWVVAGKVKTAQGDPVRSATVMVTPLGIANPRTLSPMPRGSLALSTSCEPKPSVSLS